MGHVVTGSETGIGPAIRMRLTSAGRTLIGVDLPGSGAEIEADLGTADDRQQAIQVVLEQCGGSLDGLVCNPRNEREPDSRVVARNYFGTVEFLAGLREALARESQPAAVVNVSGALTVPRIPEEAVEALLLGDGATALRVLADHPGKAFDAAGLALARWVRRQAPSPSWAGRGITLNGVAPGPLMNNPWEMAIGNPLAGWWDMWSSLWTESVFGGFLGGPAAGGPGPQWPHHLNRPTAPEQVASLVEFLLSPDARSIVGQIIAIDGGLEAALRADDWPTALGGSAR